MSDIRIRQATRADYPDVAEMHYPVWRQSWYGVLTTPLLDILGPARRWVADVYPQSLERSGWSMWIAEAGGKPLGVAIFGPATDEPGSVQLDALYVSEDSQRLGVGGLLLETVLDTMPSGDVILWVAVNNTKARRFYEKQDFRADGRTLDWEPLPGIRVAHVGYRLTRR